MAKEGEKKQEPHITACDPILILFLLKK